MTGKRARASDSSAGGGELAPAIADPARQPEPKRSRRSSRASISDGGTSTADAEPMTLDDGEGGGGSSDARQGGQLGGARRSAGQSFSTALSLEDIRSDLSAFAQARDWEQFHTPRNLALALTGEVGELCECFQWKGDTGCTPGLPGWSEPEVAHLGDELADVMMYLVRLSDRCGVDLPLAVVAKLQRNGQKYPADRSRGSSAKYTAYL